MTRIAIVIPVCRDEQALDGLLRSIHGWTRRPHDVVVVSALEHATVEAVCRRYGVRCLQGSANRGAQLDDGARAATADVLWFLHADAHPPAHSLTLIGHAVENGAESGCFRFGFRGPSTWYKRLLAQLVNLRVRFGGIPYGDQALFARRDAYQACGGFARQPLFEEVSLVKRLRARGTFAILPAAVGVSPRRWERDGWWRRTWHNRWLAVCYALGVPTQRLARAYRRPGEESSP